LVDRQTVLVCGLGRIGLECIKALRGYRVPVRAIDLTPPGEVELDGAAITQGDFRRPEVLQRAGIAQCRSIVLLADDTASNVEGALAARRLNPQVRLVLRGEQQSLHGLLSKQLGNLVVYEPNLMAAPAFAFAALDSHILAHFYIDNQLFQIFEHTIEADDALLGVAVEHTHLPKSQVLLHLPTSSLAEDGPPVSMAFYGWQPGRPMRLDDRVVVLTAGRPRRPVRNERGPEGLLENARWVVHTLHRRMGAGLSRPAKVALWSTGALGALLAASVASFAFGPLQLRVGEAFRVALLLLSGGHLADVFDPFVGFDPGVYWVELVLVVVSTVLTAVLYALLTDRLLTARFLLARRPHPPTRDHVIVAGLGATGERIASVLQRMYRPVVAVDRERVEPHVLPRLSIVHGSATDAQILADANIAHAHGIVAATSDDLQNVEIALLASNLNRNCRVAVRTFDPRFTENVSFLLPDAKVLCVSSLAATAYAAAALGEHVLGLFQLLGEPVLVVEYTIAAHDTLVRHPLWEIAEGYSVVPVLYQGHDGRARVLTPDDTTTRLCSGDRLVVLATPPALEAIERGELRPRDYELHLESLRPYAEPLQVVGILANRLGYSLEQARATLAHLPQTVPLRLYGVHAARTQRLLHANGVQTRLERRDHPTGAVSLALG
jgi:Trk K+ transport system NAD-binding subunit